MSQTSYALNQARAREGMVDYQLMNPVIVSKLASVVIPMGRIVARQGTDTHDQCSLADATGEVTGQAWGVSILDVAREQSGAGEFPVGWSVPILRRGYIWLLAETDMTQGLVPFVRFASGAGGTALGKIRKDADTATAVALPGLRCETTIAAAGLVLVSVNLP